MKALKLSLLVSSTGMINLLCVLGILGAFATHSARYEHQHELKHQWEAKEDQQQQPWRNASWRGQDEDCFAHGTWVSAPPRAPPYPQKWGNCGVQSKSGSESFWMPYAWRPTYQDVACARAVARAESFEGLKPICERLGNRTVLFVGDSLSYEQWESLVYLAGFSSAMIGRVEQRNMKTKRSRLASLCGEPKPGPGASSAQYIRNDRLQESAQYIQEDGCSYCFPFWDAVAEFDVVVFNTGAHVQPMVAAKQQFAAFVAALTAAYDGTEKKTFVYRTTVPGHPGCRLDRETNKTAGGQRPDVAKWPHGWEHIPPHNRFAVDLLRRKAPFVHILDAAIYSDSRPDRHNDRSDCLHYCQPGPVDWWNKVLLALLS